MTNEIMYYGGMITAILFGILSIVLFFVLHIYAVVGDLTGITAKRRIKKLKDDGNGQAKGKLVAIRNNTSKVLVRRNRTTIKLDKKQEEKATLKLFRNKDKTVDKQVDETVVLKGNDAETTVLQTTENETTVLKPNNSIYFEMEKDIVITHSDEKI